MIERTIEKKLLWPSVAFLSLLKKRKTGVSHPVRRLLVIRLWTLGESILVLPMIKRLKEAFPAAKITVLCSKRNDSVFYGQEFIDELIPVWTSGLMQFIASNRGKYDLAIDTEPHFNISAIIAFYVSKFSIGYSYGKRAGLYDAVVDYNDKQHAVFTICDLLSPLGINCRPRQLVPVKWKKEDEAAASQIMEKLRQPIIGIHPGCGGTSPWREWPEACFAELIARISNKKRKQCTFVLTGSKKEEGKIERIMAMARKKGVKRMVSAVDVPRSAVFYMISKYSLMVSNDTGPMHVSASLGVKTIGLFGPNMPVRFGPFPPEKNIAIYHKQECSPCINVHKSEFRKCPYHGKCMKAISVDEVFEAASKYL